MAAVCQPLAVRPPKTPRRAALGIGVHRLGVVARSESDGVGFLYFDRAGRAYLTDGEILKVTGCAHIVLDD